MGAPLQQEIVITVNAKTIKFNLIIKKYQISVYIGKFFFKLQIIWVILKKTVKTAINEADIGVEPF